MNAEQVVEKILSQAKAEAASIVEEAQAKAAEQKARLDSELAAYDKQTDEEAQAAAENKKQRMHAAARMSSGKKLLGAKVAIMDAVFARAEDQLTQMPDEEYLSLMADLMKSAVQTGDEQVIVGKQEKRINDAFIKRVNRELGAGFKGNLRLADERADIKAGFLLARGKVRINASSAVLLGRVRDSLQIELAEDLFADSSSTK